jgi:hypothetical protein
MDIISLKGTVPVYLPGSDHAVEGVIESDLYGGFTVTVTKGGPDLKAFHALLADGQIVSLSFMYKPSAKVFS